MVWMIPVILLLLEVALLSANIALALSVKRDLRKREEDAKRAEEETFAWYNSLTDEEKQAWHLKYESENGDNDGDC